MHGTLAPNLSPRLLVEFYGAWGRPNPPQPLAAIVDTGFTGGVSIPITKALPLGLTLLTTANFTLADGSTAQTFICLGMARVGSEERVVAFSLSRGSDILIGTEFLSAFNMKVELDYRTMAYSLDPQSASPPTPTTQQPSGSPTAP